MRKDWGTQSLGERWKESGEMLRAFSHAGVFGDAAVTYSAQHRLGWSVDPLNC